MYGSLFREWKVAAMFVCGIAIMVAVFFSEGGGYEELPLQRKVEPPAVEAAPPPQPTPRARPAMVGGFTPDAELEAAFAVPTDPATPQAGELKAAEPLPSEAAAPTAAPAPPAEASPLVQQLP